MTELSADGGVPGGAPRKETSIRTVVVASAAGTAFEWYDFFLFVPLAAIMSRVFFSGLDPTAAYIFALGAFAIGFAFRPMGALIFGRVGDRIGRKATFLVTMSLMGVSTFLIGFLPSHEQVGIAAPLMFIGLRILQGLALGGEWGGAAIYIVEHAPKDRRGISASWLGGSAAFGLAGALIVVMIVRAAVGTEALESWAWRIPFLVSAILLGLSIWIRLKLHESPVFAKMKDEGRRSEAPYRESFAHWPNLKLVLLALFGIMIAQGAVWYAVFFYAGTFMDQTVKVAPQTKDFVILVATFASVPMYTFFGWLSDRVGRKAVMLGGLVLMIAAYFPAFHLLERFGNPALAAAQQASPVTVVADPADCSFQFDPIGQSQFTSACDIAKSTLARAGVSYANEEAPAGAPAIVRVGAADIPSASAADAADPAAVRADVQARLMAALREAGYPERADPDGTSVPGLIAVVLVLTVGATALYGPQAAALVEMFPARVRYTALSLPYHIGTGWVGGFLPATAFAIVAATGDIYAGLWYPFAFTLIAAIVMTIFLREMRGRDLN